MTHQDTSDLPLLHQAIDVDAYLVACPAYARTRGTFLQDLVNLVESEKGHVAEEIFVKLSRRRWSAFNSYPLKEFIRLAANTAGLLYEDVALSEGLRRLGRIAYPSFRSTMAGRVVMFALGDDLEAVIKNAPHAYKVALPQSEVSVDLHDHRCTVQMRNVYNFVTTYQYGVIEGALMGYGYRPSVRVHALDRLCDADFELEWH